MAAITLISDTRVLRWRTQAYNTRRHLHASRRYTHPLRPSLCECIMSVIRWLVVQEVCISFDMRMLNIPLLLCYTVHLLYFQPIRLTLSWARAINDVTQLGLHY